MPMEIDRNEIKRRAKEAMSLSRPSFWIVTFVYLLMTTGVSFLADLAPGMLGGFLTIAITLYSWVVGFSYRLWALWSARRLNPGLGSLMDGFSVAGRVILLELGILVRTVGWTALLSFCSAFLMMLSGSMALTVVLLLLVWLGVMVITLRYSMAYYVLADYPDLGASIAIAHSVRLCRGWTKELVKLHLSFAGWYILSYLLALFGMILGLAFGGSLSLLAALSPGELLAQFGTLEITPFAALLSHVISLPLTLYFTPYLEVTLAHFYDARINLADNMADPLGGMKMPPL